MQEERIEELIAKYIKDGDIVSIGTSDLGEKFLKKLALFVEEKGIQIKFVPTSLRLAGIASELKLPIVSLNEEEVDIAIEFVDQIDEHFNFIKQNSHSLVRDKILAQSSAVLIAIAEEEGFVKKLSGKIPFEISPFAFKVSLAQLSALGKASLKTKENYPVKTETGHYIVEVEVDNIYSLDDLDFQARQIPGVLETGLFLGYADKIILHGKEKIKALSRTEFT